MEKLNGKNKGENRCRGLKTHSIAVWVEWIMERTAHTFFLRETNYLKFVDETIISVELQLFYLFD